MTKVHMQRKLNTVLATFFYLGKSPKGPGTVGTLGAIPLVLLFSLGGDIIYMSLTFLVCLAGIFICQNYENESKTHDNQEIVIDEVAGYLIAMAMLPLTFKSFLLAFVLFRLFDILKPFPIGIIDKKVKGGIGVMADDIIAGIITSMILQFIYAKLPGFFESPLFSL